MKKDIVKLLVVIVWAFVLLTPMMGAKLGFDSFEFDLARPMKLIGLIALGGVAVVLYRAFAAKLGGGPGRQRNKNARYASPRKR